ncbi:MAG: hypothetical protein JWO43_632, partial [Candidatus Adlerbacteria bacterium]|nr:hypothetical protein [Candidatus Adlerbacteria bacterium]
NPVNQAPYVSLNQVPYTGFDLGPSGLVISYSFLGLMALLGWYLIAVKKVQNKLVARLAK